MSDIILKLQEYENLLKEILGLFTIIKRNNGGKANELMVWRERFVQKIKEALENPPSKGSSGNLLDANR